MSADILEDPFHGMALQAFLTVARRCGDWPASEDVRRLAYALYEAELAQQNPRRDAQIISPFQGTESPCSPMSR